VSIDFYSLLHKKAIKGQTQRNLDNFSFVERPLWNSQLHQHMKQNQLLKISFVRPAEPKTWKTDDFRELHENQPEMAALEWKRNYRYLWRHIRRALFRDYIISLRLSSLFQRCPGVSWLPDVWNRSRHWSLIWQCPNTAVWVRTIGIRQRFSRYKFEWMKWHHNIHNGRINYKDWWQWWASLNMLKTAVHRSVI